MRAPIYVLGHRNPDSDSICAAIGYAALLHAEGKTSAVAARQGVLRRETASILQRFDTPAPILITDLRPRVADVMSAPAQTVNHDTSLYEVGHLLESKGIRAVPVVDDDGRLCGVTGVADFAQGFMTGLDLDKLDQVPLELDNLVRTLGGNVLVEAPDRPLLDRVMVGAMEIDSMLRRIEPGILLVMGDREDAQRAAIEHGVGALVITGDHPVSEDVVRLARARRVSIIAVPHHTFTTVRLIHLSTPVRHVMRAKVSTCRPDDLIEDAQEKLRDSAVPSLVVVGEDRTVAGVVSRTDLLRPVRRQVALVDHNERGQAVAGIEEADVVAVIDHHRIADFQTRSAPFMRVEPAGSTSTIVAKLFDEGGIAMDGQIAGVLLAGILADTLLFKGPTTTPEDRRVAEILAQRAGIDVNELGQHILTLASDVSDRSADQLLAADFKDFSANSSHFGIGVIETTDAQPVLDRRDEILAAMSRLRERGYTSLLFAIIDIVHEQTTLLVAGHEDEVAAAFDAAIEGPQTIRLPGIVSRKKHIVPLLGDLARRIDAR